MTQRHSYWFRASVFILAIVLVVQSAWLLGAEFFHSTLPYFQQYRAEGKQAAADRSTAVLAASIGWLRGELWADAAIALASGPASNIAGARTFAERAARLSPHDSRVWLLLAALDSRLRQPIHKISNELKMSYYTGPNELALTPLRLRIATGSTVISDADLKSLVAQEIRTIILQHQDKKSSILAAYRGASPEGKKFIEATVGDLDKNLLAALRDTDKDQ